ncbi:MAG TPA: hypothetical protein VJW76_07135, partial [Verrucomicrobiae bacterium]|nr:hypothetical protein [Verrucomicrobiae bacterium]
MSGAGGYGYATAWTTARSREIAGFPLIHFSQPDIKTAGSLTEDLNVMSLLLEQAMERAVGESSPAYKMGIPMLLHSGARGPEAVYIEDFGVLFAANVNFPLLPPPAPKEKETEPTTRSDDWETARKQLLGRPEAQDAYSQYNQFVTGGVAYDAERVTALKKELLDALKNAANIRSLKPDEFVVLTISGTDNVVATAAVPALDPVVYSTSAHGYVTTQMPASGRRTVLTIRVKKSDADAFSKSRLNLEQFQQKATINAYIGAVTGGSAWQSNSYPGRTPSAAGMKR